MTFNDSARVSNPRVRRRSRAGAGVAIGGGGLLVLFLLSQLFGVDLLGGLTGEDQPQQPGESEHTDLDHCTTGQAANEDIDCRMVFVYESLDAYWVEAYPEPEQYTPPTMELFSGAISTACGQASSAVGPFYCPPDQGIYLDTDFFATLSSQLGAQGGPLAEMYVVAHEWGHHIQNLTGIMDQADRSQSGPGSDAIRLELQADCLAGAWAHSATTTLDSDGEPFLQPFTDAELATALDAAAAVGDDHIQERMGGSAHPESWTHGSSAQRQDWFTSGYESGANACDTFAVPADEL